MALAADRDAVAREYVTDFALTFEVGVPAVRASPTEGLAWTEAAVEAYLTLLASTPDTHIARKLGPAEAESVSRRAREVRSRGRHPIGRGDGRPWLPLDAELRDPTESAEPRHDRRPHLRRAFRRYT